MKKPPATIIINGKHFNAQTGHALGQKSGKAQGAANVDGILPQHIAPVTLKKTPQQPLLTVVNKPVMDIARSPARHVPKVRTQPGKTLMRTALKKPQASLKRTTKVVSANAKGSAVVIANVSRKTSAAVIDDRKLQHAQKINQSSKVKRFTPLTAIQPSASYIQPLAPAQATVAQAYPEQISRSKLDMFEMALASAVSHEQVTPPHVRQSLRKQSVRSNAKRLVTSSLAVLLIAGFIGYQNLPNLKFQYASSQAGFSAALPDYRPPGFSVGKLTYETGAVSVNFHSNSDDRAFSISQQPSAWDSQALRDNAVATNAKTYRTVQVVGRTVFLYGNGNATWVNGGIWYTVTAEGSLTEHQLTEIARTI